MQKLFSLLRLCLQGLAENEKCDALPAGGHSIGDARVKKKTIMMVKIMIVNTQKGQPLFALCPFGTAQALSFVKTERLPGRRAVVFY